MTSEGTDKLIDLCHFTKDAPICGCKQECSNKRGTRNQSTVIYMLMRKKGGGVLGEAHRNTISSLFHFQGKAAALLECSSIFFLVKCRILFH